ncbi:MAG: hypothetical protein ACI4QL_04245 [Candidatus Fimimonas sp.]
MEKSVKTSAILLLVTAVLLVTLFACNFSIGSFFPGTDNGGTTDNQQGLENVATALVFVLGVMPSLAWPVCAVIYVVFGILFLVRKITKKTKGSLIALVVLGIVFGVDLAVSMVFLMSVYLMYAQVFAAIGIVLVGFFIASFVSVCVSLGKVKKGLAAAKAVE